MNTESIQAVANCVSRLNTALIERDAETLKLLTSPGLSYGHSKGKVENREQFIGNVIAEGATQFVTIDIESQTIGMVGSDAIVRHSIIATTSKNGVAGKLQIQNLLVWQKVDDHWELIARQAFTV